MTTRAWMSPYPKRFAKRPLTQVELFDQRLLAILREVNVDMRKDELRKVGVVRLEDWREVEACIPVKRQRVL